MSKECGFLPNRNEPLCVWGTQTGRGKKKWFHHVKVTWFRSSNSTFIRSHLSASVICTLTLAYWNVYLILLKRLEKKEISGRVVGTRLPSGLVMWRCKISDDVFCMLAPFGNSCRLFWTSALQSVPECPACFQPSCPPLTTTLNFLPNPNLDNKFYPVVALSYSRQFAKWHIISSRFCMACGTWVMGQVAFKDPK